MTVLQLQYETHAFYLNMLQLFLQSFPKLSQKSFCVYQKLGKVLFSN